MIEIKYKPSDRMPVDELHDVSRRIVSDFLHEHTQKQLHNNILNRKFSRLTSRDNRLRQQSYDSFLAELVVEPVLDSESYKSSSLVGIEAIGALAVAQLDIPIHVDQYAHGLVDRFRTDEEIKTNYDVYTSLGSDFRVAYQYLTTDVPGTGIKSYLHAHIGGRLVRLADIGHVDSIVGELDGCVRKGYRLKEHGQDNFADSKEALPSGVVGR